jgi:beta-aspartyl-dipeptidase (metallo-type)
MLVLVEHGAVYAPEPHGVQPVLLLGGRVAAVGGVDGGAARRMGPRCEVIDASGCLVLPGLVDPHQHLLGAGGEEGFGTREPEVTADEVLRAGMTTVVGCLGTDTTTRPLVGLLGKVRELTARGLTAFLHTGGFAVPPVTLMGRVEDDIALVPEVVGVGELALSDDRSYEPTMDELARLVSAAMVGGRVGGKAGVVHFHVGGHERRLRKLHRLLDDFSVPARQLYPTHCNRSPALMDDAVALAKRGAYVDVDTIDEELPRWLRYYRERGGPLNRFTASSDAHTPGGAPAKVHAGLVACVREAGLPLEEVLRAATSNPADALGLRRKGRLAEGMDADLVVVDADTLAVRHVVAGGRVLLRDGRVATDVA